ncbi:MAG: hypothetical protein J6P29_04030, partial [Acetobacter sp.]|nr:hypothetical protein [Acetobacter sp.]
FKIFLTKVLVEKGELCYQSGCDLEAEEIFSKIIEDFKESHSKWVYICLAKAYVGRGVIRQKRDNKEALEDYNRVIEKFSEENDYPDVVLAVAQARLNLGALCRRTNYDELYQMKFNCSKFSLLDLLYRKSIHNEKYHDELLKLKALAYWNARQWPDVLKTLDCVKGKDTENTEIDTEIWQLNNFRFWKGKPISLYEVFVNTVMKEGNAYQNKVKVFKSLRKIKDCVERQRYGKINESLSKLVDNVCKEIIKEFIDRKYLIDRKYSFLISSCHKVTIFMIETLKRLEKEFLLNKEQSDYGKGLVLNKEQSDYGKGLVYNKIFNKIMLFYIQSSLRSKSREDIISLCNNLFKELPLPENKYYWGIMAFTVPIHDRLGQDNVVIEKCKKLDDELKNFFPSLGFSIDRSGLSPKFYNYGDKENFYILLFIVVAFLSRWRIRKRRAVEKSKGWEDMVQAGEVITVVDKKSDIIKESTLEIKEIKEIKEIVDKEKDNEGSVIREKVFNYYQECIEPETDDSYNKYQDPVFREDCIEFIRTFSKVVDDPKIKEKVDKVVREFREFIRGSSCHLEEQDKQDMLDEIAKWHEFPDLQQYIDRLNNN